MSTIKKTIIVVSLCISTILFSVVAIWCSPYVVNLLEQTFEDKKWISSGIKDLIPFFILSLFLVPLVCTTVVGLIRKHLRLYSILFIPHIIAISIAMVYIASRLDYEGDGYIRVRNIFSRYEQIRNGKGVVILDNVDWRFSKKHLNNIVIFTEMIFGDHGYEAIYDEDGVCFLRKPNDDDRIEIEWNTSRFYSEKSFYDGAGYFDHARIRFYDSRGNYLTTREYGLGGYRPEKGEMVNMKKEYREDMTELAGGIKDFKGTIKQIIADECSICHGIGQHKKIRCKTCGGIGKIYGENPKGRYGPSPEYSCNVCGGSGYRSCPNANGYY